MLKNLKISHKQAIILHEPNFNSMRNMIINIILNIIAAIFAIFKINNGKKSLIWRA